MPRLIRPTPRLRASWMESWDEWGRDTHQDGSGLRLAGPDVGTVSGFGEWVTRLRAQSDRSLPLPQGSVHATHLWVVEDDTYLGTALRPARSTPAGSRPGPVDLRRRQRRFRTHD